MRIIDETGIPADEREHYAARPSVEAVRCDDGVTFAFKGQEPEEFTGPQVVVIDGDNYTPIASDIFDALYAPAAASQAAAAAPAAPAGVNAPPTTTTQVNADTAAAAAAAATGDNPPPTSETTVTQDGGNIADETTTPGAPAAAPAPSAEGDGGTPSVTGLTQP